MLTIIFTIIAIYVIFNYILKPMVGYFAPLEISGRLCLQELLWKYGIDPKMLPIRCLEDFVRSDIKIARFSSRFGGEAVHSELIKFLDVRAGIIARQLSTPRSKPIVIDGDFMSESNNALLKETVEILQRYHLIIS